MSKKGLFAEVSGRQVDVDSESAGPALAFTSIGSVSFSTFSTPPTR